MIPKWQTRTDLDRKLEFPKHYRPIQLIGGGGFATVFAAERFTMKRSAAAGIGEECRGTTTSSTTTTTTGGGDDDGSSLTHEDFDRELVAIKKLKDFTGEWISNPKAVYEEKPAKYQSNLKNICRELSALKTFAHIPEVVGVKDAYLSADGKDLYMVLEFEQVDWNGFFNPPVPDRKEEPRVASRPHGTIKERELEREKKQQKNDAEWKKAVDAALELVKPRLIEDNFRFMMCQVLIGLHAIHSLGYVHRDLSSGNLLINEKTMRCLIADFGLCRSMMEEAVAGLTTADLGTRPYRAPEILAAPQKRDPTKSQYNALADIWSAGCALVEMCIGTPVFDAPCGQGRKADDRTNLEANGRLFYGYKSREELELINADPKVIDWMEAKVKNGEEAMPGVLWKDLKATDVGATIDKFRQEAGLPLLSDECKEVARAMVQFLPSDRKSAADLLQMPWFQNDKRCRELIQERLTLLEEEKNSAFSLMEKVKDEDAAYEQCIRETLVTQGLVPCDSVEFSGGGTESAPLGVKDPIWDKLVASGLIPSCLTPEFCSLPKLEKYSSPSATYVPTKHSDPESPVGDTVTFQWSFRLDEFDQPQELGQGGMGAVYHGLDEDGVDIAVKELNVDKMSLKLIAKEVKVFKQLNHRNIVSYHGFETRQGRHYILMEYAPDGTLLGNLCSQKPGVTSPALRDESSSDDDEVDDAVRISDIEFLPLETVVSYTRQILEGLAYLHDDQKLVHRDLKPANILLFENKKRVKIADFGTCKASGATKTGMGTDGYGAPEVYDSPADATLAASDVWSLGCVVVDMLSGGLAGDGGEPPFFWWEESSFIKPIMNGGDSYQRLIDGVHEGLYKRRPDLSGGPASGEEGSSFSSRKEELDLAIDFIKKCFSEDPKERPTARSLLEDPFVKLGEMNEQLMLKSPEGITVGKTFTGPAAEKEHKGSLTVQSGAVVCNTSSTVGIDYLQSLEAEQDETTEDQRFET